MKKIVKAVLFSACLLAMIIFAFNACGKSHQHVYLNKILINEPTHTEKGAYRCMCPCGHIYIEEIATIGMHTYYVESTKEPTHTEYGVRTYTCRCGESYTEKIEKIRHTYVSQVTKEPTHLTYGIKTFTCSCGYSYTEDIEKTTEHSYVSKVTKEPTHLTAGTKTFTCDCGDSYTEEIAKIKHTYVSKVTKEPTHLTVGTKTFTCTCGESYVEDIAKTTEHTYIDEICECGATAYVKKWDDISASSNDSVIAKLYNNEDNSGFYSLKISGTGYMKSWSSGSYAPWYSYRGKIASVEIGEGVTSIGSYAFYNCTGLKNLTKGESVINIGSYAFSGCNSLTSLTIPENVGIIGSSAFSGCNNLTSLTIPESVGIIGNFAFYGCTYLTEIIFNAINMNDLNSDSYAFSYAGQNGEGIKITFGDKVKKIPDYLFCPRYYEADYYAKITSITIGESVTSIGDYAFYYCTAITEINFNAINVNDLSGSNCVFSYAGRSGEGIKVTFGDKVTKIPAYLFYPYSSSSYTPKITSVTIGNSVTSIGDYSFFCSTEITNLTIDNCVISIGEYAFYKCTGLTSVTIGESLASMGEYAFYGCDSLIDINVSKENTNYESIDGNLYTKGGKELVQYAIGKKDTQFTIPNSVTSIGDCAFSCCTGLTSITIPNTITSIGRSAFENCTSLKSVTFENTSSWYRTTSSTATSGTSIDVTNAQTNAKNLRIYYCYNYWKRNP